METKGKNKKTSDKANGQRKPLKDLRSRKEDSGKVQGGGGTYGPED